MAMTELQTDAPAGRVALRRRYGAWNAGREPPPAPLFFEPERGRWIIASYEAALAVFEQRGSDPTPDEAACPFASAGEDQLSDARALLRKNLLFQTSPNLERLRRILMQQIGVRAMAQLEPALMACARDLLDRALDAGGEAIEVVEGIARPFVNDCLFDLIGAPAEHRAVTAELADAARGLFELGLSDDEARMTYLAFAGLSRRVDQLLFEGTPPQTALATNILEAVHAQTWTREEAIAQVAVLVIAARTSSMTAIATLIHLLATHAGVWDALRSGALPHETAIEEALRLGPPAPIAPKTIVEEAGFGDVTLAAGERVLLLVGSANRDPAVFADPDRFDPWRPRRRNLAFGAGRHKCPGHTLAHLQLRSVLVAFLDAFPVLELAAPPEYGELLHGERPITRLVVRSRREQGA